MSGGFSPEYMTHLLFLDRSASPYMWEVHHNTKVSFLRQSYYALRPLGFLAEE